MAIGLNAVREICTRCPLAMSEDSLRNLVEYKNYRDRSVMMAARSGRPTEATQEHSSLQYAQIDAKDYISGDEVLLKEVKEDVEIDSESNSDDHEWVDIPQSDDKLVSDKPDGNEKLDLQTKRELAKKVTLERILTDEDFKRIKLANIQKQVDPYKKGQKRKLEETDASVWYNWETSKIFIKNDNTTKNQELKALKSVKPIGKNLDTNMGGLIFIVLRRIAKRRTRRITR
ncbi:hypothetical protein FQR65_LT09645 [Abscondita terminalis]|nr:hypothetical protein FQR65_LT09645 [Abscondita terminalis]